ncbi:hypothetical protein ACQKEM_18020 [Pseudomonas sp. NPDC077382]
MAFEDKEEAALELFKHYSGIRFLLLPLFFTAMGATVVAYWNVASSVVPSREFTVSVAVAGMLLWLFFVMYEIRLSITLLSVSGLLPESMKQLRHKRLWGWVTTATLMLYGAPALFWSWRAWVAFCT